MDPVSVAASVVGLLGAVAQLLGLLTAFIKSANGDPKAAQDVLSDVADIGACLWKLQSFLLGIDTASASRTSLIIDRTYRRHPRFHRDDLLRARGGARRVQQSPAMECARPV